MCNIDLGDLGTWAQVCVSIFALYFLRETLISQNKTLDSQQKTLDSQQEVTRLELDKYKSSNMPFLSIEKTITTNEGSNDYYFYKAVVTLKINDNVLSNLDFSKDYNPYLLSYSIDDVYYEDKLFSVGDLIEIQVEINEDKYNSIPLTDIKDIILNYDISFLDKNNIKYKQILKLNNELEFHITPPIEFDS